jgi:hypothetical protein
LALTHRDADHFLEAIRDEVHQLENNPTPAN